MFYKNILFIIFFLFLTNCTTGSLIKIKQDTIVLNPYKNKGFALIYSEELYNRKIINKKIDERSLIIFQKSLKTNTQVKITNILNGKSLIGTVKNVSKYPSFNNSVLSIRIVEELNLDIKQPYVEILEILENSIFIAKKAKTYAEERTVAIKAPVNNISINDLNIVKNEDEIKSFKKFSYIIKIADFYFRDTALEMIDRIKAESSIKSSKIKKISDKKYRVYLGPFTNINSLQRSFNGISILEFENLEIIIND